MERFGHIRLKLDIILEEIIQIYNLRAMEHNGYIYCEIQKGMYGLPQVGILANLHIRKLLERHG